MGGHTARRDSFERRFQAATLLVTALLLELGTCSLASSSWIAWPSQSTQTGASKWGCDITSGEWVGGRNLPLYTGFNCPYVRSSQNCQKNGRQDMWFQKLKWRPHTCRTRRMTPKLLRNQLRDKLVLVFGDSVAKNFATSVMCVLHSSSPNLSEPLRFENRGSVVAHGMQIPRYNIRVASVTSNFLTNATDLPLSSSSPVGGYRVNLDQLQDDILNLLPSADLVVFQATNWWWSRSNKFFIGDTELTTISTTEAYEIGLQTLRFFVERAQQRAFKGTAVLLGASPTHYDVPLQGVAGGSCQVNQKLTWLEAQEVRQGDSNTERFREVERRVLLESPIQYLDVGPMSDWRPDGHIQRWMDPGGASPSTRDDCRHWCEGGVTDAWLEMLYNTLLH
ncbi:hypothetical protein CLOP_g2668 [Closterium sp. NIES-67]|nr:hypothetical protein CLOP_g25526 [Closterium sp. NIES-67]GJP71873.1 hypothetical protein CLOP_g2668 [Closterium sp. NIES-67]